MLQGRAQLQTVTIGGSRDGRVLAYRLDVLADAGAYPGSARSCRLHPVDGARRVRHPAGRVARSRRRDHHDLDRGLPRRRPAERTAIERAMDLFAAEIGMDPVEVRRRNLIPPDAFPFTTKGKVTYDSGEYAKALDQVLDAADYAELRASRPPPRARRPRPARHRRLGVRRDHHRWRVRRRRHGRGAPGRHGHRAHRHLAAQARATRRLAVLASEQLGVPVEMITVKHGDTDLVPRGAARWARQPADRRRRGALQAAVELVEIAQRRAADVLEAAVDDLEVADGAVRVRGTEVSVPLSRLAESEPLRTEAVRSAPPRSRSAPTWPWSRSTSRSPARRISSGSSPSTTPGPCSTR